MRRLVEDAALSSNLDCRGFALRNIFRFTPVPDNLADSNDPIMSGTGAILDGSVTNESVSETAAIAQSKLLLNGNMPPAWLGSSASQAARGDLAELLENKGATNGYVPLGPDGKIPVDVINVQFEPGTVNTVALSLPPEFNVAGSPINETGSFAVSWNDVLDQSWFGAYQVDLGPAGVLTPKFQTLPIPAQFLPVTLDAAKITTGTFSLERLPLAVGLGDDHAIGMIPDPGENGDANEFLGRDMQWRHFSLDQINQPTLPPVQITTVPGGISIHSPVQGSVLFYRVGGGIFLEVHVDGVAENQIIITPDEGQFIEAYAARPGYNNSPITTFMVPITTPP